MKLKGLTSIILIFFMMLIISGLFSFNRFEHYSSKLKDVEILATHKRINDLITDLQIERGRSSYYLSDKQEAEFDILLGQQALTSLKLKSFFNQKTLSMIPKDLIIDTQNRVNNIRQQVQTGIDINSNMKLYTGVITKLLSFNSQLIHLFKINSLYPKEISNYLHLKEKIGLLRGTLAGYLNESNWLTLNQYSNLDKLAFEIIFFRKVLAESSLHSIDSVSFKFSDIIIKDIKSKKVAKYLLEKNNLFNKFTQEITGIDQKIHSFYSLLNNDVSHQIKNSINSILVLITMIILLSSIFSAVYFFNLRNTVRVNTELIIESQNQLTNMSKNVNGCVFQAKLNPCNSHIILFQGGLLESKFYPFLKDNNLHLEDILMKNDYLEYLNALTQQKVDQFFKIIKIDMVWFRFQVSRNENILYLFFYDVTTEIKQLEKIKLLYGELDHRVKNNLQMISIFVDEYKESLKGRYNIGEITKLNSRIDSLLLSHTFLSKHSQEGQSFKDFILLLTTHLENSLRNISFSFDLEDFILEKSKFIPLSLLMNELIINSSKHYIKNEKNKICIKSIVTSDRCTISYLDHGNFAINNSPETKGLQLINLLSQQLEGGLEIINYGNNKEFKFTIPR